MKKIIYLLVACTLIMSLSACSLFSKKDKSSDTSSSESTSAVSSVTSSEEASDSEDSSYKTIETLPGVNFKVPKTLLDNGTNYSDEITDKDGKTILYSSGNGFGVEKKGSFILGVSYIELSGIYNAMYPSTLADLGSLKVADNYSMDISNLEFNYTSFSTQVVNNQKDGIISVKLLNPDFSNDVYNGYVVLATNPSNQGYVMFVATTGTEYSKIDIQTIINSLTLTGDSFTVKTEATKNTVDISIANPDNYTGSGYALNTDTGEVVSFDLASDNGNLVKSVELPIGTWQFLIKRTNTQTKETVDLFVKPDEITKTITAEKSETIKIDPDNIETYNSDSTGYKSEGYIYCSINNANENDVIYEITNQDKTVDEKITLNSETLSGIYKAFTPGEYNVTISTGKTQLKSTQVTVTDKSFNEVNMDLGTITSN